MIRVGFGRRRLGARLGAVTVTVVVTVVMVMPAGAVMVVRVIVAAWSDRPGVNVRPQAVTDRFTPTVCVAERGELRQQHARQKQHG